MNKEEYYKYIEENDTYPSHSHKWIARTYTDRGAPYNDKMFYRNFGPFETSQEAKRFLDNYKAKYTTKGSQTVNHLLLNSNVE
jgi:hypothetical protein